MSLEIRPLVALYPPPPPNKNVLYRAPLSVLAGAVCSCLRNLQSKKYIWGGYNAARGLISRDIAPNMI